MLAEHVPTWVIVAFLVFGGLVVLFCLSVAIDMELWYREIKRGKKPPDEISSEGYTRSGDTEWGDTTIKFEWRP